MKLISSIEEVRDCVPVSMTENIEVLKTFLASAESQFIKPLIGKEQFDVFCDVYKESGNNLNNLESEVVKSAMLELQKAVANLGYLLGMPVLNVSVGPSGVQIFSNTDTKSAFQWQVDDLKRSLLELGYNAIEQLFDVMENNLDLFPEYEASEEKKRLEQNLIESAIDFDNYYFIRQSRFTFSTMIYIMFRIEKQVVEPMFGREYLEKLRLDNLEGKNKILVNEYLKPGIALLTIAKAVVERIVVLDNGVASVNLNGNFHAVRDKSADERELLMLTINQLTEDGNMFLQNGMDYVLANAAEMEGFIPQEIKRGRFKAVNKPERGIFAV